MQDLSKTRIAVIGLGYVGMPLAVAFSEKYKVIGFDINKSRISELRDCNDRTLEVSNEHLKAVMLSDINIKEKGLWVSDEINDIKDCTVFIVTVPTPTDSTNRPDLSPMIGASKTVARCLKQNDVVIYESTVYPGVTEDVCVPILEKESGMIFNKDFFAGYSPERINPGDKEHTVTKILKVTSGSTPEIAEFVDNLYSSVIVAGTFKATSIKVAEAAKVIENSQRDINIAFINELSKIFNRLGIDTQEVLDAAGTKWNFLKFKPGLVGGHCIGVDPYYLAQKAQELGYHPEIILAGRRLNDGMGGYVADEVIKLMVRKSIDVRDSKCLLLGFTFKENCPDFRNTKVIDIINGLKSYHIDVTIFDPWVNPHDVMEEYGVEVVNKLPLNKFESVILAVAHEEFKTLDPHSFTTDPGVIFDVKGFFDKSIVDGRL